jgi:hypothetical protein
MKKIFGICRILEEQWGDMGLSYDDFLCDAATQGKASFTHGDEERTVSAVLQHVHLYTRDDTEGFESSAYIVSFNHAHNQGGLAFGHGRQNVFAVLHSAFLS